MPSVCLMRLERGFTLVEILVAVAVSSIALAALYASYDVVQSQHSKIRDVADLRQGSRNILEIIKRDVRMAGFAYRDDDGKITFGAITHPLTIVDSKGKCCDQITVVYDYVDESQQPTRHQIKYWVETHTGTKGTRGRLYKQNDILLPTPVNQPKQVMADHIEDLQFLREKVQSSGSIQNIVKQATNLANSKLVDGKVGGNSGHSTDCATGGFGAEQGHGETITANFSSPITIGGMGIYAGEQGDTISGDIEVKDKSTNTYRKVSQISDFGHITAKFIKLFTKNEVTDSIRFAMTAGGGGNSEACVFELEVYPASNLSNLVDITLVMRTLNTYGLEKKYEKKSYRKGNWDIDKKDAHSRTEASATVLVRNLSL